MKPKKIGEMNLNEIRKLKKRVDKRIDELEFTSEVRTRGDPLVSIDF